ncbi:plasmid maintenance protein CcdB [Pseudothauera nasutitermitis]|uniref:Toxin CcdB n=1 Tax=Pseudothauera nasutitermitis TaxID=2565930 RepID=A0A4S4ATG4_9RHOO|nr:CcdB family protein [Pseudothauera nasutitermitis]THF63154.1 plasmid maintenance protein CcdB [Pseudothauera nasutitermitis]
MARFDVYRNPAKSAPQTPYLLDVQADLLDGLDTRVVIPLRRRDSLAADRLPAELMPEVMVEGVRCVLETPKLAAVPLRVLGSPVCSMAEGRTEIVGALDFLFQGY